MAGKVWPSQPSRLKRSTRPLPHRSSSSTSRAAISVGKVRPYAQEVGLELPAYDQCLSRGTYQAVVPQDVDEGIRADVTGTPACFSNGRLLAGAQPLVAFVGIIAAEPARAVRES
jgi:protein-disulfide isomerase